MTPTLSSPLPRLNNASGDARTDWRFAYPTGSQQSSPTQWSSDSSSTYKKHERFYFDDGNITFVVQNMLYNVHRYFFCRDSSFFSDLISKRSVPGGDSALSRPFLLTDVQSAEFDALLCILYPSKFNECEVTTVEEWTSILHLATRWSFSSIRELAISHLDLIASPIDKIVLGRIYRDRGDAWLVTAFADMCQRPETLTKDEGRRLGIDDTVLVACLRESRAACSTKLTADQIYAAVEACLVSPDIADHGPISFDMFTPAGTATPNAEYFGEQSEEETKFANEPNVFSYAGQPEAAESDKDPSPGRLGDGGDADCEDGSGETMRQPKIDTMTAGAASGSMASAAASQLSAVDTLIEESGGGRDDGKEEEEDDSYVGGESKVKKGKAKKGKGKK